MYLELASDISTEIKTPFLGLEPCNTDTTLLLLENLGKIFSDGHSLSLWV